MCVDSQNCTAVSGYTRRYDMCVDSQNCTAVSWDVFQATWTTYVYSEVVVILRLWWLVFFLFVFLFLFFL